MSSHTRFPPSGFTYPKFEFSLPDNYVTVQRANDLPTILEEDETAPSLEKQDFGGPVVRSPKFYNIQDITKKA